MPLLFYKDQNGDVKSTLDEKGGIFLQNGPMWVSSELRYFKHDTTRLFNKINGVLCDEKGTEVSVDGFGIGSFLFSDNFVTCQPVVARLTNEMFALFHSFGANVVSEVCQLFIREILKIGIKELYVFQKNALKFPDRKANYDARGARFIAGLQACGLKPHTILVDEFRGIVVDAKTNTICLSSQRVTCLDLKAQSDFDFLEKEKNTTVRLNLPRLGSPDIDMKNAIELQNSINKAEIKEAIKQLQLYNTNLPMTLYKIEEKKDETQNINLNLLVALVEKEIKNLADKRTLCCFPAYNASDKVQKIKHALNLAKQEFKSKQVETSDLLAVLDYKKEGELSLKEALEISRWRGARPHMYSRIVNEINKITMPRALV